MGTDSSLLHTPLHTLHQDFGGKMVPFAGYSMPLQYTDGIMAEHRHVREQVGLFDVSHMGRCVFVHALAMWRTQPARWNVWSLPILWALKPTGSVIRSSPTHRAVFWTT